MALTTEQLADIEFQKEMETARSEARSAERVHQSKTEALRMAHTLVLENHRNSVDAVCISASDVTSMASELLTFIEN